MLPAVKSYKGYLAPLTWIFSYLWLTAFIFASQDYDFNGGPLANSPAGVKKSALKKTLEAFAFIALWVSPKLWTWIAFDWWLLICIIVLLILLVLYLSQNSGTSSASRATAPMILTCNIPILRPTHLLLLPVPSKWLLLNISDIWLKFRLMIPRGILSVRCMRIERVNCTVIYSRGNAFRCN